MSPIDKVAHDRVLAAKRNAKYRSAHRDRLIIADKLRRDAHREQRRHSGKIYRETHRAQAKAYRQSKNPDVVRAYMKAYIVAHKQRNRAYYAALQMKRSAAKRRAMPAWVDKTAIASFYQDAARLTRETGIPHEVDHIYPLRGRTVSGLHCEANLRVVPRSVNRRKSNTLLSDVAA